MRQKKHLESSIALALAWRIFLSLAQPRSAQGFAASNAWGEITSEFCDYHCRYSHKYELLAQKNWSLGTNF